MTRYIICILILTCLALSACAPSAHPTQDPARQATVPASTVTPTAPAINSPVPTQLPPDTAATRTPQRVAVPTVAPTFAPNPLTVQVKLDTQIRASAVIPPTGGTLSVQGSDGTQFTLTFPRGALSQDTEVTLTPVTRVEGLPFSGGWVGGVQMAPEGLRLLQPATLTIESSKTVAAKGLETVALAYHENGEGLYLNPAQASGNVLMLEVWHFSGAGAAQGTPAEIQTQQQQHVPANPEDALIQRIAEYIARQHQAQIQGQPPDPDFGKNMAVFAREYYDRFIAPQLPLARQDCAAAPAILSKALGWSRQLQLLGIGEDFASEDALIWETIDQAIANCYNKEYEQCVIDHAIKHRTAMLQLLRQAMLLGIEDQFDQSKIEKCTPRFEVDTSMGVYSKVPVTGVICALDRPFALIVDGHNPSGGQYVGELAFTPTSETAGSWRHAATSCISGGKCGKEAGNGTYRVEWRKDSNPMIMMDATTASSQIDGYVGTWDWPAWQIELEPAPGSCGAE